MTRAYRRDGRTCLVKDPLALLSAPWLARRFGFRPVILVRHPCAFVSSVLRIGWTVNFRSWLRQERLVETLLAPWRDELEAAVARPPDAVLDAALFWRVCTATIGALGDTQPGWLVVRHEDLAADPEASFRRLYDELDLTWSDAVAAAVAASSSPDNPTEAASGVQHALARDSRSVVDAWRARLSPEQVDTVVAATADVARRYYPEEDWST